jgi:hypothetical protein
MQVESLLDFQSTVAIKQFFELGPNWSLLWGLSAADGRNGTDSDNRSDILATDIYIKYRPITTSSPTIVSLQAEWFWRRRQLPAAERRTDHSGYVYLLWRFARRWVTAARYEYGSPAKDAAGNTATDDLDPDWTRYRKRYSAQLTFLPTEFSRIRWQASVDDARWLADPIVASFLSFEFLIGAHGAHKF